MTRSGMWKWWKWENDKNGIQKIGQNKRKWDVIAKRTRASFFLFVWKMPFLFVIVSFVFAFSTSRPQYIFFVPLGNWAIHLSFLCASSTCLPWNQMNNKWQSTTELKHCIRTFCGFQNTKHKHQPYRDIFPFYCSALWKDEAEKNTTEYILFTNKFDG